MKKLNGPDWLILIGSSFFIFVLALSAVWQADIRWLHFFQAWMYIATIMLALRKSRWGYFLGIAVAGLWDYTSFFVNTFFWNGLKELWHWLQTGHLQRADQLIAVPAWTANLLVVMGCLWGYMRLREKRPRHAIEFAIALVTSMAFFALDMYLFQPRYLGMFRGLLHPRLPW